jgi:hypothetical protein
MVVVTQWEEGEDEEAVMLSSLPQEESMMRAVRAWWQARARCCKPFWLYGGVGHIGLAQLRASLQKYEQVARQVQTEQPADMLRSLYPLVSPSSLPFHTKP